MHPKGSGTFVRCNFGGVDMTLLEEVCYYGGELWVLIHAWTMPSISVFFFPVALKLYKYLLLLQHHVCLYVNISNNDNELNFWIWKSPQFNVSLLQELLLLWYIFTAVEALTSIAPLLMVDLNACSESLLVCQ